MDVAFIHPSYPSSEGTGATHSATQIIKLLDNRGHNVVVYCAFEDPPKNSEFSCRNLNIDGAPYHSKTNLNSSIKEKSKELQNYDIVHSYLPSSIPAINTISQQSSTSTAVTLNAYGGICPKNDLRYKNRENCNQNGARCVGCILSSSNSDPNHGRAYRSASLLGNLRLVHQVSPSEIEIDGFQALSNHIREKYSMFGYPEERISVIPNILDEKFLVDNQSSLEEPYELLYVGYLRERKGVLMLPKIMERLQEITDKEVQLTVVGDGFLRGRLEDSSKERGVSDIIDFQGHVSNDKLPSIYASHDLFVYPGEWDEPFGRVLIEALAAETPVLGTNVGAVKEIIGNAGTVTEPKVIALAKKIRTILENDQLGAYTQNTRERALQYRAEEVGELFDHFYSDII